MGVPDDLPAAQKSRDRGRLFAVFSTAYSVVRGIPLFFAARPKTPLRVLCIIAFDAIHLLRTSQRIPIDRTKILSAILDFGACANAELDGKYFCRDEFQLSLSLLQAAGIGSLVDSYLRRLKELEKKRPFLGGNAQHYQRVRRYRESVVTLSLGMIAAILFGNQDIERGMAFIHRDNDLRVLFRIVMQCQIIDDILDYSKDLRAELPGFLTATATLRESIELTNRSSQNYGDTSINELLRSGDTIALRSALSALTAIAKIFLFLASWRHQLFGLQGVHVPEA